MINGLNYNGFEQLNGLHLLYADEIQIDKIDQKEINTLDNINTTTTIQEQIDNLDETYVNYDYLYDTYYHYIRDWFTNEFSTKTDIKDQLTNISIDISGIKIDLNDNYYNKTYINTNFYPKYYINNTFTTINSFDTYKQYVLLTYYTSLYINNNYYTQNHINSNFYDKTYIDTQYNSLSGYITYLNEYITSVDLNLIDFYVTYDYLANTYDSDIKTWSSNQFNQIYTKTEINNQNLTLSDYITTNYTNLSNHVAANYISINSAKNKYYEKTYIDSISGNLLTNYYTKTQSDNNYYNKTYIDSISGRLYTKYYDASYIDIEIYKTLTDRIDTYHYTKNDINYKFITISDYILSNYNLINQILWSRESTNLTNNSEQTKAQLSTVARQMHPNVMMMLLLLAWLELL